MTDCLCCPKQVYKCKFCNREMGFHVDRLEAYFCVDCNMIYIYREDTTLAAYGFIVKHRDIEYRMIYRYSDDYSKKSFRIFVNDPNFRPQGYVIDLDFHPENITPQNAKSKLETYLAFL